VAIAAGRKLAHRLFNDEPDSKLEYENIPSVVFTHPPIGEFVGSTFCKISGPGKFFKRVLGGNFAPVYFSNKRSMYKRFQALNDPDFVRKRFWCFKKSILGVDFFNFSAASHFEKPKIIFRVIPLYVPTCIESKTRMFVRVLQKFLAKNLVKKVC
jgi:pyruvate/2-oxoglutarate dehydrogenase complex dihydrolipoamide dehydrogenase (E3) component